MANLVPGYLFRTPGLNRNFTHLPNTITPKDQEKISGRQSFHRHSWSTDNSVTRVYDVSDTNNNNYRTSSRLSGYDKTEFTRIPDPDRHFRAFCTTKPSTHRNCCYDSASLYKKPGTNVDCLQRAHTWSPAQTTVNQKRHTTCKVSIDPKEFLPGMTSYTQRQHRTFTQKNNIIFPYPDMPPGAKLNLCTAERIYSSRNLLGQKRKQYMVRLIQKCRGVQSMEYVKYMRYINQSKTGPLPSKTGWSRPMRLPNVVDSVDSTNDNSPKQQTPDEKTHPSSERIQKSDQVGNSKYETEKQVIPEQEKQKPTKQAIPTDHTVTGTRSHNRSRLSSLTSRTSRNEPARSQISSRSQESTQRGGDINSKDEPKDVVVTCIETKGENSDKHLFSVGENEGRQANHKGGVDIPTSQSSHVSPMGSVHEELQVEDQKDKQEEGEMDKMSKVHDSRPSTVLTVHEHVARPESVQEEDQKPTDVKQGEAADGMDKKSNEHDSRPSTVLSVLGHVERPESEKTTSSKGKGAEEQMHIDHVQETKSKSGNKAESLVSIRSNHSQQIYRASRDTVDKDTDEGASKDVHRKSRGSGGEDSPREGNKEIYPAQSDSEEAEDDNSETRRGSREIYEAQRNSVDTEDEKGERKRGSGEIHRARDSKEAEDDKGEARRGSGEIHRSQRNTEETEDNKVQRESNDGMNRRSQEHNSHPLTAGRPETGKTSSREVQEKLQEDQKSTDFEDKEYADEMSKKSKEQDFLPSTFESVQKTSNIVHEKLQEKDQKISTVERPKSETSPSNKVYEALQEEDQNSTDFKQRGSADEINKMSRAYDSHPSTEDSSKSRKKTSIEEELQGKDQKSTDFDRGESADEMKVMSQGLDPRPSAVERPNSGKSTSSKVHEKVQVQDQKLVDLDQRESI